MALLAKSEDNPVVVVGGGAAGLHAAIRAAETGTPVVLVSRKPLQESSSYWAQGGLAAALSADDTPERHAADTLAAGRGLCRIEAVETLVEAAPSAVEWLVQNGVRFDEDTDGALALGLEGGHTARRIVHAGGSQTGRELTDRLARMAAADPRIEVQEGASAQALWSDGERCFGVVTEAGPIRARAVILATGGGAALWQRTTNPWGAIGAGPVLAHQIGAELADLEFCQFHPTALSAPGSESDGSLITEAVRGEGATLLDASGNRFTDELAPRDQVAAAIGDRMRADGTPHVHDRPARDRAQPVPERLRDPGAGRLRPAERASARGAGGPLPHGRHRHRHGRPLDHPGPLRRRRVRMHRPPRRQQARVELTDRVLRLRRAGRAVRDRRLLSRRRRSGPGRLALYASDAGDQGGGVGPRRALARCREAQPRWPATHTRLHP